MNDPFADMAPDSERRECPTCGLTWFERYGHTCPMPWPYERAREAVELAAAMAAKGTPMIVHPRVRAAIRMGMDQASTPPT